MPTDYYEPVRLPFPGRRIRKVERVALASLLIFLVTVGSVAPLLPEILGLAGSLPDGSRLGLSNGKVQLVDEGPKVSLPPGTIGVGERAFPQMSQAVDGAIPSRLIRTDSSYDYYTSFGKYSFDRTLPYAFKLRSDSGNPLTTGSFFFVTSGQPLLPGLASVTLASDNTFQVGYEVVSGGVPVGHLRLTVDFFPATRPKFTISFQKTVAWSFGDFNIVWLTLTVHRWLRDTAGSTLNIESGEGSVVLNSNYKVESGPSADPSTWREWVTTDWADAPGAVLKAGYFSVAGFAGRGHILIFPTNKSLIDPTQVSTSTVTFATGYSTQRKTFYYGGHYFVFYNSGSGMRYKISKDLSSWSSGWAVGGQLGYNFDLYQSGPNIALTWLNYDSGAGGDGTTTLYFKKGTVYAGDISWTTTVNVTALPKPYSWPPSVGIGTDGTYWIGGVWSNSSTADYNRIWVYKSTDGVTFSNSINYETSQLSSRYEAIQLLPLPQGKLMVLTSHYNDKTIRWRTWNPVAPSGAYWTSVQSFNFSLPANANKWNILSATTTPDGFVHTVFKQYTGTNQIVWSYYNITSGQWTIGPSLYSGDSLYPTVASDGLGNLYAFWMSLSGGTPTYLMYSSRLNGGSWSSQTQPFGSGTLITNAAWLSAVRSGVKQLVLTWTVADVSPYKIVVGSLPLPSGIATSPPLRPWSKVGLSPHEQYFTQNGEYASPGNGLLTISHTDISVPGRNGLSLSIGRVYSQPFTLVQGSPFNYETNPYANLGNGWQLGLPWVGAQYVHFADGQLFPLSWNEITTTFPTGHIIKTYTVENHETEDFLFTKTEDTDTSTWITTITFKLTAKDGSVQNFDSSGRLTTIIDRTGQNQLSFSYTSNRLATITDTVGRVASFSYDGNNRLANATYGSQTVRYGYSGSNLVTVTDAANRAMTIRYLAQSNWLVSGVVYTAGGNSSYTFGSVTFGTDAVNYYVTLQNVFTGSLVRTSSFSYNITDGEVAYTSIKQSDGISVQGYTEYGFNAPARSMTRTVLNGTRVQMVNNRFWYDASGRSVQEDVFTGNSLTRSFFNNRFYDLWGNVIHTRDNVGHESYQSFGNTDTQFTFRSPGRMTTTTEGRVFFDDFNGPSLNTSSWVQGGSASSKTTTVTASLLKLSAASSSQGTWQSNWVRSSATYGYPFYAEVHTANINNPGDTTISAEFILSPQQTASNGNPFQNADALRLVLYDWPRYKIFKTVGGTSTELWSGTDTGIHSVTWKVILTDRNTLSVYLNRGASAGYELKYSTSSLGLSTSFTPSYAYLSFGNLNTGSYTGIFDFAGLYRSNSVTINGLEATQKVELYDWNDLLKVSGTVGAGQSSITLDATNMDFPYAYFKIYELDGRTLQFVSPIRDVWGGGTYSYTAPFKSGGLTRTSTGLLKSSTLYVEDSVPSGATTYSEGGDAWAWTTSSLAPVLSGAQSHVGFVVSGTHRHYFQGATTPLSATSGYFHIQYVYIPATSVPQEIMLEFHIASGNWEHRAYWGTNLISWGTDGTASRKPMGTLPSQRNSWIMLIAKTNDVGTNGLNVDGLSYVLYDGGVQWDYSALGAPSTGNITITNLVVGQKVEVYDSNSVLKTSKTVPSGSTSVSLDLYSAGINAFPFRGFIKIYKSTGSLQYSSPLMTDLWGGDTYKYDQPVFNNFFDPGPVGTSIHNAMIGTAQYQNSTSVKQETYAKYDSVGNMVRDGKLHDGALLNTTYTYDTYGNRLSELNANSQQTFYAFSATYQRAYLTNTTRVLNANTNITTSYAYNSTTGSQVAIIDPKGNRTDYQYDALSRLTVVQHPAIGGSRSEIDFTYQDSQNNLDMKNEKGNYTRPAYDGLGRVTTVDKYTGTLGSQVLSEERIDYQWQDGIKNYNASGPITTYAYDYFGRLVKVTNPGGTYRTVSYDDVNLIQSNYDENGHRTDQLYDPLQRLIGVREYYSSSAYYPTTYVYDEVGNLLKTIGANRQILSFTPTDDAYIEQANPNSNFGSATTLLVDNSPVRQILLKFNIAGVGSAQVVSAKLRMYDVDASNKGGDFYKTTTSTWSEGTVTWNNAPATTGSAIATLGSVSANTWYQVDLTSGVTGDGVLSLRVTSTSSDGADYTSKEGTSWFKPQLIVTISTGQTTNYTYDDLNRLTLTKYPDGFNETRTYDNLGNMVSKKDPNGNTVTYTYDNLNRLTNVTYPDGTKANFAYDKNGNRIFMSNPNSTATFAYDARNRPTSETWTIDGSQYTINYSYDTVGNLAGITYPDGVSITYSIDAINRATSIKKASTSLANITYTSTNNINTISYANGVQTTYTYNSRDRPSRIKTTRGSTVLLDLNYTYDNVGNVQGINTESYTYDFLNRLTYSSGPWSTLQYGYDAIGNRQWYKEGATNTTYAYGSYNRLLAAGSTSYTYDNDGNLKSKTVTGVTSVYNYDFENRLTKVTQGGSTLGAYGYDPLGLRIKKVESGVTTVYLNQGVNVLYEKQGSVVNDYVMVGQLILAKLSSANTYYFHQDHLGSTRLVTIGSSTDFSSNYQPFGSQYGATGNDPVYKYTGQQHDSTIGLYYYGARYYDTTAGRFISRDPASGQLSDGQSYCKYAYARNNPERFTDPTGACLTAWGLTVNLVTFALGFIGIYWGWSSAFVSFVWQLYFGYVLPAVFAINSGDWWRFIWSVMPGIIWKVLMVAVYSLSWWQIIFLTAKITTGWFYIDLAFQVARLLFSLYWLMMAPPSPPLICW